MRAIHAGARLAEATNEGDAWENHGQHHAAGQSPDIAYRHRWLPGDPVL